MTDLIKPHKLNQGDTIGVFTPSTPAYVFNEELFKNGINNLQRLGFKVNQGHLTKARSTQGYRSASPQERAEEFMNLIMDSDVKALIPTIGGYNSSSLIPYLDFEQIRHSKKIICGYSDITSLHMAILHYSGLKTFYGPMVMTWFGEYPHGVPESIDSFLTAVTNNSVKERTLTPFKRWSNHMRNWENGDWKNVPRKWEEHNGWNLLSEGTAQGEIVIANLNTLSGIAGTDFFPDLENKILIIEEMDAPFPRVERSLRQLSLMGVFEKINGLLFGRPEEINLESAQFSLDDLILEIIGNRDYLIISDFDCSHTVPMITLQQRSKMKINAQEGNIEIKILENYVE